MEKEEVRIPVCISKNTKEICNCLERLGYEKSSTYDPKEKILWTSGRRYYSSKVDIPVNYGEIYLPYGVWCKGDQGLFLSLAAITNSEKWFTDRKGFLEFGEPTEGQHEASLPDLIKFFGDGD